MITTPNRLAQIRTALESGQAVDFERIAALQAMDLVIAGRQFVEEAAKFQEDTDDSIAKLLAEVSGGDFST